MPGQGKVGKAGAMRRPAAAKPDPGGPASSFAPAQAPLPEDAVEVARVLGAWGVKGGLKLKPYAAQPQALLASRRWWLQAEAVVAPTGAAQAPQTFVLNLAGVRAQGEVVVAECRELHDRDAAQALAGARVFVPRASFPPTDEDEFYWVDLIGLAVHDRDGRRLGVVTRLIETGPHCVLCIQPADAGAPELLIPFVQAYVDRVDRAGRTIHVDWEAGD